MSLAGCEADPIGSRATLQEWGYTGIGITAGPVIGRPCRWGEPFAVRFTAHDERGAPAAGWLCATDESADDARILLDGAPTRSRSPFAIAARFSARSAARCPVLTAGWPSLLPHPCRVAAKLSAGVPAYRVRTFKNSLRISALALRGLN